jgi:BMFP domain-containing protein YqiC
MRGKVAAVTPTAQERGALEREQRKMFDKMKQEAMRRGMMLMSNPKVMKMMADPRVMNAITQGYAIKGRIQTQIESRLRGLAQTFNLATREDVESLRQTISRMEDSVSSLERRITT